MLQWLGNQPWKKNINNFPNFIKYSFQIEIFAQPNIIDTRSIFFFFGHKGIYEFCYWTPSLQT